MQPAVARSDCTSLDSQSNLVLWCLLGCWCWFARCLLDLCEMAGVIGRKCRFSRHDEMSFLSQENQLWLDGRGIYCLLICGLAGGGHWVCQSLGLNAKYCLTKWMLWFLEPWMAEVRNLHCCIQEWSLEHKIVCGVDPQDHSFSLYLFQPVLKEVYSWKQEDSFVPGF